MEFLQTLIAKAVGVSLLVGLSFLGGYLYRDGTANREALEHQVTAFEQTDRMRQDMQGELYAISERYTASQANADAQSASTIAQLHSDGIRLRIELADAKESAVTGSGRCEPDGYAELSDRSAEFLIGQARKADDQVTALQQTIRVLQEENTPTQ
nr:lysis system i-spanin subunit Rz [Pseudomonas sp. B14(2017)]